MTLIAQFAVGEQPILIGDVLLSGPELETQSVGVPTIGDTKGLFPKGTEKVVLGVRQKVTILSADRLMMAWAGQAFVARRVLSELKDLAQTEGFDASCLRDYFRTFERSKHKSQVQFLGCVRDGNKWLGFEVGDTQQVQTSNFGKVSLAGTGASDAKSFFDQSELPQLNNLGNAPPQGIEAVFSALTMAGHFLQLELNSQSTLRQYYGGGYEIATIVHGKFQKIGNVSYIFWYVDARTDAVKISIPYHAVKLEYWGDALALRIARIGRDLKFQDELHVIDSILGDPIEVQEQDLLKPADMNSKLVVNFFFVRYPDGSTEWLSRVDLKARPESAILFRNVMNGYEVQMEKGFIDYIREAVINRRAARNLLSAH
jgi:hypothetical protein